VEFRQDGNIRTKHVRPSGDMQQQGGAFKPSDIGTCKTFQNIARYCFVKAGKNGSAIGASPADDAANKALVIFKDEILDFLGGGSYTDDTAAQHSQQSMDDKMKMHKQKKDLEMKLKRKVTDMEFQKFLATGEEPKPKSSISMNPDKLSDIEKRQEILRAKYKKLQEIFGLFNKSKSQPTPQPIPQPKIDINSAKPTIEGIDALGNGYSVWSGQNPIGDMRHLMGPKNIFDNITIKGVNYRYYMVNRLMDRDGRLAYFTVSTPNPKTSDEELKQIADNILAKNKDKQIKIY
jgi:hypothetical protein